jgi:hypothetical protein
MKAIPAATLSFLRIAATVMVLSWLIGLLFTVYAMTSTLASARAADPEETAKTISMIMCVTSVCFLLFPFGAVLHWFLAKNTGFFSPQARQALFWSSLFMCIIFPVGTIMGGLTLWALFTSDTFRTKNTVP